MAKSYIKYIANLFGLELGEKFKVVHSISEHQELEGLYYFCERGLLKEKCAFLDCSVLSKLLNGDYLIKKLPWMPEDEEVYYFPDVSLGRIDVGEGEWEDCVCDNRRYEAGMVCKTEVEARKKAKKMLGAIKEK